MTWQIRSTDSSDTERLGEIIGELIEPHEVIELRADLGGGKTTLVRGIVRGLGSKDTVTSPTFTLSKVYTTNKTVLPSHADAAQGAGEERKGDVQRSTSTAYHSQQHSDVPQAPAESSASADEQAGGVRRVEVHHYDFYRLSEPGILTDELAESLHDPSVITIVEWSDIVRGVLPNNRLTIELKLVENNPYERDIFIHYLEPKASLVRELETAWVEVRP